MTRTSPEANGQSAAIVVSRLRAGIVHATLLITAAAIFVRAAKLQLVEGEHWAQVALEQQVRQDSITPPRGRIVDATGDVLVETRELFRIGIAPRNVVDRDDFPNARTNLRRHLAKLGVAERDIRKALDTTRAWVQLPRVYRASELKELVGYPGVWREPVYRRSVSASDGLRRILGVVDAEGEAHGGVEEALDSLLEGRLGTRVRVRHPGSTPLETPEFEGVAAQPGNSVQLTINRALQEIAETELANAMRAHGATGGDIVILDVHDGAILAMAGARDGKPAASVTAVVDAYEAGSVIKPLLIAHVLELGRAHADEIINTENGRWRFGKHTYIDEHKDSAMSVRDVVRFSSNIGAIKLTQRLSSDELYQLMRDLGFGTYTGVPFPAESRGVLYKPSRWSELTVPSLAMGYEMLVTPLQLAAAYLAIANGGELLQPGLIREIRTPNDELVYRHERHAIRRAFSPERAAQAREFLGMVVDSGTGTAAQLGRFDVAGKSGTSKISERGVYTNKYNATFAGMFPAQDPQLVVVARLIEPRGGQYYGGVVAGPMVQAVLTAAIAARDGSLDRHALAAVAKQAPPARTEIEPQMAVGGELETSPTQVEEPDEQAAPDRVVITLPVDTSRRSEAPARKEGKESRSLRPVPTIEGLNLRQAVHTLNAAGFQVRLSKGSRTRTSPAAGAMAREGAVVVLEYSL